MAADLMRNALRYGAWPTLTGGSLAAVWWAVTSGRADPELLGVLTGIAVGLACWGLERVIPFEPAWSVPRDDLPSDALHAFVGVVVTPALVRAIFFGALARAGLALGALAGRPNGLWPRHCPLGLQLALLLVVSELGGYLAHRAQHRWRWLWPMHAIHHAAPRVYFFNGLRLHAGDTLVTLACAAFPAVLLGAGPDVLALFAALANAQVPLQHANADLRLGPLNYVISGPELHRWHHSRDPREGESNYGGLLIVWDVVFRTMLWPRDRRPPADVGLYAGESIPDAPLAQLWWPFSRAARDRE